MGHKPIEPYPKNAPGPFYTENESCMACEAPASEAPGLIAQDGHHCYFKR